jgi:NAD(P)-dependent dehydrogenase (short-subunit alcohol dehydrogenase family)
VGWSAYCASKAGLSILTRVLAIEESDARGIRVYGLCRALSIPRCRYSIAPTA